MSLIHITQLNMHNKRCPNPTHYSSRVCLINSESVEEFRRMRRLRRMADWFLCPTVGWWTLTNKAQLSATQPRVYIITGGAQAINCNLLCSSKGLTFTVKICYFTGFNLTSQTTLAYQ